MDVSTFFSKYIETADQLSKEVGEDNPGLNVFDCYVQVTRVDKRINLKIWTKWFGMC